ncbi:MAG: FecCD family ABC transporter permease [Eubacteriales bacterium]
MIMKEKHHIRWKLIIFSLFLMISIAVSLNIGRYPISLPEMISLVKNALNPFFEVHADGSGTIINVFFSIRLPRIILAVIIGAALGASGTVFQGIFKNPLASPDILGVSSGCSFGAALGIIMPSLFPFQIQVCAFVFGIAAMCLVYVLAHASKGDRVIMLVLAGMIVSALFCAGLSIIKYTADPLSKLPSIVFWTMGSLNKALWSYIVPVVIICIPCLIALNVLSWKLNILALGTEDAKSLGINVVLMRNSLIAVNTLLIASCTSISGTIAWVGLIIPHISRIIIGHDHRYAIPMSMLCGGIFILWMDNIARGLFTYEIPIGILTALLGAPFFAYLLVRGKGTTWR